MRPLPVQYHRWGVLKSFLPYGVIYQTPCGINEETVKYSNAKYI